MRTCQHSCQRHVHVNDTCQRRVVEVKDIPTFFLVRTVSALDPTTATDPTVSATDPTVSALDSTIATTATATTATTATERDRLALKKIFSHVGRNGVS